MSDGSTIATATKVLYALWIGGMVISMIASFSLRRWVQRELPEQWHMVEKASPLGSLRHPEAGRLLMRFCLERDAPGTPIRGKALRRLYAYSTVTSLVALGGAVALGLLSMASSG